VPIAVFAVRFVAKDGCEEFYIVIDDGMESGADAGVLELKFGVIS